MAKKIAKKPSSHETFFRATRPAYLLGLLGSVITLAVSIYIFTRLLNAGNLFISGFISFLEVALSLHLLAGILMLTGVYLLRKEHHTFSGSIILLTASIVGLNLASGLIIGPLFGLIAGILGLSEHEKLIRRHLD